MIFQWTPCQESQCVSESSCEYINSPTPQSLFRTWQIELEGIFRDVCSVESVRVRLIPPRLRVKSDPHIPPICMPSFAVGWRVFQLQHSQVILCNILVRISCKTTSLHSLDYCWWPCIRRTPTLRNWYIYPPQWERDVCGRRGEHSVSFACFQDSADSIPLHSTLLQKMGEVLFWYWLSLLCVLRWKFPRYLGVRDRAYRPSIRQRRCPPIISSIWLHLPPKGIHSAASSSTMFAQFQASFSSAIKFGKNKQINWTRKYLQATESNNK